MKFLGYNPEDFEIMLLQMVTLLRDGQPVKMSKRTGQAVTLRELMDEVGSDAARYFFCSRTLDSQMDFDIDLAKSSPATTLFTISSMPMPVSTAFLPRQKKRA